MERDVHWGTAARNLAGAASVMLGAEQAVNRALGDAMGIAIIR